MYDKKYLADDPFGLLGMGSKYTAHDVRQLPLNTSEHQPIRVDWVDPARTGTAGKLGLTLCPGRRDIGRSARYDRNLYADMKRLRRYWGVNLIVVLIEAFEFRMLKVPNYFATAEGLGLEVIHYPIKDGSVPRSVRATRSLVDEVVCRMRYGENVLYHCKAGLGRAGEMSACTLTRLGYRPDDAITVIRQSRVGTIENQNQERFVHRFRGRSMFG
jgi:protein-tyrosine phosphatase